MHSLKLARAALAPTRESLTPLARTGAARTAVGGSPSSRHDVRCGCGCAGFSGFATRGLSGGPPPPPPEDGPDSHDDFKPVSHVEATPDVKSYIDKCLAEHKVFLFMKGNPQAPQCGFSNTAVRVLQHYNVSFGAADVLSDPELREGIKEFSKWPTIPQVYVDKEFLGGSDILMAMHQSGELAEVFGVEPPKAE